jgi:hypothetical protein
LYSVRTYLEVSFVQCVNLPWKGILYSDVDLFGSLYSKSILYSVWTYLSREGILYSVLTYLGGWAVWVGLCIKITPDLPKIQGKTINSVPELTFS